MADDVLYLSPHLDDVVLSCSAQILADRAAGQRVVVATLFSHACGEGEELYRHRRQEDETALALLGAEPIHLGLLDAPFRRPEYHTFRAIVLGTLPADADDERAAASALEALLQRVKPVRIHVPLGVGTHIDHRLTHAAALKLIEPAQLVLYEDRPYVFVRGQLAMRLTQLGFRGEKLSEKAWDVSEFRTSFRRAHYVRRFLDAETWRTCEEELATRLRPVPPNSRTLTPRIVTSDAVETVIRAIAAYRSQFEDLFGDEATLRAELAAYAELLGATGYAERSWTLARQLVETLPLPASKPASPQPLAIPGYEVLEELGRGGMGVVYKARQVRANRLVALKMVLSGQHADAEELTRFRTEAEALARLQHPNIVQVYEVDEHDGRPFFSLEYCSGGSLEKRLNGTPLPARDAVHLVETLAQATAAAHRAGIVHRDLKPANVLLASPVPSGPGAVPPGPDGTGLAKISDFGLAKKLDDVSRTAPGAIMGTPSYMAPEQADGKGNVGLLADVYALGAILYECLTGRPPFKAATTVETLMQVIHDEPVPPSLLSAGCPRDVETICLKCLHKEPAKRYADAAALADDLRRFLDNQPIKGRPVGRWERAVKWVRRRPAVAALTALVVLVSVTGLTGIVLGWREALSQRQLAQRESQEAQVARASSERNLSFNRVSLAEREWRGGNVARAVALLDACPPAHRFWEWRWLRRNVEGSLHTWASDSGWVNAVAFRGDGRALAVATEDGIVLDYVVDTGERLVRYRHDARIRCLARAPKSGRLALADHEGRVLIMEPNDAAKIAEFRTHTGPALAVAFNSTGDVLASGGEDGRVVVRDLKKGVMFDKPAWTFPHGVTALAFRSGSAELAVAGPPGVIVWNVESGRSKTTLLGHVIPTSAVAYSHTGRLLASADAAGRIKVWDADTGQERGTLRGHDAGVFALDFAPDDRLVSAGGDRSLRVWDVDTQRELFSLRGHTDRVLTARFSPDGKHLASGGADDTVKLWNASGLPPGRALEGHSATVFEVAFSPDGKAIASASADFSLHLWDAPTGKLLQRLTGHDGVVSGLAFHPDSSRLASSSWDTTIRLWDAGTGACLDTLRGHQQKVTSVAFHPNGRLLASSSYDRTIRIWDVASRQSCVLNGHTGDVLRVAFHPDGATLASASEDGTVRLWDVKTGQERRVLTGHGGTVWSVAFSPDGRLLASGGSDRAVMLWDARTGDSRLTLLGHHDMVFHVAFSPDSRRVVSAGYLDRSLRLWETDTGHLVQTLLGHEHFVRTVAFSPDGRVLVSGGRDKVVRTWDPGEREGADVSVSEEQRRRAQALVHLRSGKLLLRARVLDNLADDAALDLDTRRHALAMARLWEENAEELNNAALRIVASTTATPTAYREALELAERAHRLNPGEHRYLNTLGIARYRAGLFRAALPVLALSESLNKRDLPSSPPALAFQAMAFRRLEERARARSYLERLRELMKLPATRSDPELIGFHQEAEALLRE